MEMTLDELKEYRDELKERAYLAMDWFADKGRDKGEDSEEYKAFRGILHNIVVCENKIKVLKERR